MQLLSTLSLLTALSATVMAVAMPSPAGAELQKRRCGQECFQGLNNFLACSDDWRKAVNTCEFNACRVGDPILSYLCLPCADPKNPCNAIKDGTCGMKTLQVNSWIPGGRQFGPQQCKQTKCLKDDDEIWKSCPAA